MGGQTAEPSCDASYCSSLLPCHHCSYQSTAQPARTSAASTAPPTAYTQAPLECDTRTCMTLSRTHGNSQLAAMANERASQREALQDGETRCLTTLTMPCARHQHKTEEAAVAVGGVRAVTLVVTCRRCRRRSRCCSRCILAGRKGCPAKPRQPLFSHAGLGGPEPDLPCESHTQSTLLTHHPRRDNNV
jgi:hypothetical protein